MATISDTAKQRLANLKQTGGVPAPAPTPQTPVLSQSAKNIKVRQQAEALPEGLQRNAKTNIFGQ